MKTEKTKKEAVDFELYGKPTVEVARQGIPLTWELDPDSPKDAPMLYDREQYGKLYQVKDGVVYTIRLGVHSDPNGVGVISRDSLVRCIVPTASEKRQLIMAVFGVAEIAPMSLMDCVGLCAEVPFYLEYVYRSAMLESNNGAKGLVLSDNAVHLRDGLVIIGHEGLDGEIPDYCTYLYDFITLQVRVVFDGEGDEGEDGKDDGDDGDEN